MTDGLDDSVATGRLHHIQVKLAFMADPDHRPRPGRLLGTHDTTVTVGYIDDGTTETITVGDAGRLGEVLQRDDLCRLDGAPLVLVNTHYRVLGIATGPAAPPPQLEVRIASRLENGSAVELVNGSNTQPAWQLLATIKTTPKVGMLTTPSTTDLDAEENGLQVQVLRVDGRRQAWENGPS